MYVRIECFFGSYHVTKDLISTLGSITTIQPETIDTDEDSPSCGCRSSMKLTRPSIIRDSHMRSESKSQLELSPSESGWICLVFKYFEGSGLVYRPSWHSRKYAQGIYDTSAIFYYVRQSTYRVEIYVAGLRRKGQRSVGVLKERTAKMDGKEANQSREIPTREEQKTCIIISHVYIKYIRDVSLRWSSCEDGVSGVRLSRYTDRGWVKPRAKTSMPCGGPDPRLRGSLPYSRWPRLFPPRIHGKMGKENDRRHACGRHKQLRRLRGKRTEEASKSEGGRVTLFGSGDWLWIVEAPDILADRWRTFVVPTTKSSTMRRHIAAIISIEDKEFERNEGDEKSGS
ncbi:hypothetical protein KQX54_001965 [Cotesia glomerata]|uniref:Uncharacterized protein n=1 Tax=Cotesia glomerata TaxID=32391 RepID=A0AAV7HYF7_COTGL|nr:hypothetical protein KQX54_001965 [Cotesia glomerata]